MGMLHDNEPGQADEPPILRGDAPPGMFTPRWEELLFFFFLHCRTSARHCRSTTGMSEERNQISPKAKANKNKHTNQTKQHPQKPKPGKDPGKFANKVKQVKRPRPSQPPHKFSSAK